MAARAVRQSGVPLCPPPPACRCISILNWHNCDLAVICMCAASCRSDSGTRPARARHPAHSCPVLAMGSGSGPGSSPGLGSGPAYEKLPEWAKLTPSDDPGHLMQPVVRFRNPEHTIDQTKPRRLTKPVVSNTGQPVLYHRMYL